MARSPREIDLDALPLTLTPAEVASCLSVGVRQARQWIAAGNIYSFRVGRRICVPKAAIRRLLERESEPKVLTLPIGRR